MNETPEKTDETRKARIRIRKRGSVAEGLSSATSHSGTVEAVAQDDTVGRDPTTGRETGAVVADRDRPLATVAAWNARAKSLFDSDRRLPNLLFAGALLVMVVAIAGLALVLGSSGPGAPVADASRPAASDPPSIPAGGMASERVSLAGGRLSIVVEEIAPDGSSVRIRSDDGGPVVISKASPGKVLADGRLCEVSLRSVEAGRASFGATCRPAAEVTAEANGTVHVTADVPVRTNASVDFLDGALRVHVSMIAPNRAASLRVRLNDGPLRTAERGVPVSVLVGDDLCGLVYRGADDGTPRVAVACGGGLGRRIAAENAIATELAPHVATRIAPGTTASFVGERLDVHVGSIAPAGDLVRLSLADGVLEPVRPGWARAIRVDGVLCAVALVGASRDGADVSVACNGRLAGPASLYGPDTGLSVKTSVTPRAKALLLGERVRIDMSMVSPDGRAVRWSINDGRMTSTEIGRTATVPVGAGTCSVLLIGIKADEARIKASCDEAAGSSRILVAAAEERTTTVAGATASMLGGRLKVALSMISPDGEAIRISANGAPLKTVGRGNPVTVELGSGLCSVEFLGLDSAREAQLRGICDRAALDSDVLIAETTERVGLSPGEERALLDGRLPLRLSMITPDGKAVRVSAAGGPLRTIEAGRPLRFASGEGRCEVAFLEVSGGSAVMTGACDAAALRGRAFVPVRTDRVDLAYGESAEIQDGRLTIGVSMIAPDRRALRVAVNDIGLRTVEQGRPVEVEVGRGACTLAYMAFDGTRATIETACDAGAFKSADLASAATAEVSLGYGETVRLFDRRVPVTLSMISPRGDSLRARIGDTGLQTLFAGKPFPVSVDGQGCSLIFRERTDDGRARLEAGCGENAGSGAATANKEEKIVLAWGDTARLFGGRTALKLEMISPSRTGLRVAIDGGRTRSLDRGDTLKLDIGGRPCRIEYVGPEGADKAVLATACE